MCRSNPNERDLILLAIALQESKTIIGTVSKALNDYLQDASKYVESREMQLFAACWNEIQHASFDTVSCIDDLLLKLTDESPVIEPLRILMQLSCGEGAFILNPATCASANGEDEVSG